MWSIPQIAFFGIFHAVCFQLTYKFVEDQENLFGLGVWTFPIVIYIRGFVTEM